MNAYTDMTFASLARRADEVLTRNTVAEYLGTEDHREITVFLDHDMSEPWSGHNRLDGKRLVAVALCDLDDPLAVVELMDRDHAWDFLGQHFVEDLEWVE